MQNSGKVQQHRALTTDRLQVLTGLLSRVSHQEKYARKAPLGGIEEDMQRGCHVLPSDYNEYVA